MSTNYSRLLAEYRAAIPGFGHFYLRKYRDAIVFIVGYVVIALLLGIMIIFPPFSNSNNLTDTYIISLILNIICLMLVYSLIDIEYQCNLLNLGYPYHTGFRINNYGLAYHISISIYSIIGIISSVCILLSNDVSYLPVGALILWIFILIFGNTLIRKYRNVKYVDMSQCSGRTSEKDVNRDKQNRQIKHDILVALILTFGLWIPVLIFGFITIVIF